VDAFSELLTFISGLLLLRPAWRINGLLRQSAALKAILNVSQSEIDKQTIPDVRSKLESAVTAWDPADELCIRLGALTFVAASFIKLAAAVSALVSGNPPHPG
jgi:hypothetical protein